MKYANLENLWDMRCAHIEEGNAERWQIYYEIAYVAMVGMAACQIGQAPVRIIVDEPEELDGEEAMVALDAAEDFDWSSIGGDPDPGGDVADDLRGVVAHIAERGAMFRMVELLRRAAILRRDDVARRLNVVASASTSPLAEMDAGTIATAERILNDAALRAIMVETEQCDTSEDVSKEI